ncbi:MAG: discoidin domain-containing protein [Oscillospiraceae bacterium]|jgi:hypothetical protein|nr:discoidin domain-containing protein [Oscillospiraceae bacterium]
MIRNTALFRAAWHSSAANYDNTAHLITDGHIGELAPNIDDAWISAGGGTEWVYVDLGAETRIERVDVTWGDSYACDYQIGVSGDAVTWKSCFMHRFGDGSKIGVNLAGECARYVRVLCERCSGERYIIRALEVFGENDLTYSAPPLPEFQQKTGHQSLHGGNWRITRAAEVSEDGAVLASGDYDDAHWLPAVVPATALVSYLKAGAIPDPNYDDWQFQVSDAYFTADFWYRHTIFVPEDRKYWKLILSFDSINWKADVWFNGHLMPNSNPARAHSIEGAFMRGRFDVTEYAVFGADNHIAVRVYANDTAGLVTTQGLAEGPGPNGGLLGADNPTIHAAVGWDWLPTIRGRDIGILGDVSLDSRGTIELIDPWFETDLTIVEKSAVIAAEDFAKRRSVTITPEAGAVLSDNDAQWIADDADGAGFTLDLGETLTVGSVTLVWGSEAGGAAADIESRHPESYRLETSVDGEHFTNIDAHTGGEVNATWFGIRNADPSVGTGAFDGHAISDSVQGATAMPVIDMGSWGLGKPVAFPVFDPQKARYIRFTSLKRRVLNGKSVATRVREIRVYAESPQQVEQSMTRTFALDDDMTFIKLRAEVRNYDTIARNVEITGTIKPNNVRFKFYTWLEAGETKYIERAGIPLKRPHLWMPNGYGEPFLYSCEMRVRVRDNVSDIKTVKFGVRKFTYTTDGGILTLYCNGTRIVAKGGNWGMDDGLKLDTPQSYDDKVRLHAHANMTMIRNWIGMTNDTAFYDACDKYGILIWDDFWLANPVDGPEPNDATLFLENARDKIKRNRYHTALALYCGRNEGNPPLEIDIGLQKLTDELDGSRFYFPNSAMTPVGSGGGYQLAYPGGNRGVKQYFDDVSGAVLRSERGIPNPPSVRSLRKFIAPEHLWPISEVWALHDWTYHMNGPANSFMHALQGYLGGDFAVPVDNVQGQQTDEADPVFAQYKRDILDMTQNAAEVWTIDDFDRAAQMINYEHHHGLFDALAARRSNGLLMWMSQSSWPSLMWQTYDWYLDGNGGYYGARAGNQPTRAVWDPRDDSIVAANNSPFEYKRAVVTADVWDMYGKHLGTQHFPAIDLGADAYGVKVGTVKFTDIGSRTDIVFLRVTLTAEDGALLGRNAYWHNRADYQNYRALNELPSAVIDAKKNLTGDGRYTVTLTNTGDVPAVQVVVRFELGGRDVLPVFWSDNYVTVMPHTQVTLTAEYDAERYLGEPTIVVDGWNLTVNN